MIGAIALAGVAGLVLGAAVAAWPGRLGAGLTLQALATGLLGASGAAVLFGADAQGAAFRSTVDPALGLDALSGFFLVVLALTAVPALVFARPYLATGPAARSVGALTAAFLLALTGLLAASPSYDLERFGLEIAASPRHADVLLVTGAVTTRMAEALRTAYDAMPEPRLVAALGDCALGCGVLGYRAELAGALEDVLPVDIRIPGCPPAPQTIAEHLLAGLDRH